MTRVRFAPSPTGDLHVGGLRTALYNVLFARKTGGKFILRIEDTDQERNVPEAVGDILQILHLCGLDPDEGPEFGGPHAPYVQSWRLQHYRRFAESLLEAGHAYPCFCSEERLKALREEQRARGQVPGYDRYCRSLNRAEAQRRMNAEPYVLRLTVPETGDIVHHDRVWGTLTFPLADVDDQVLVKSNGYPTYHLANVVDDHLMEITHVIRGEEWLPSVPKHLLLYHFLEIDPPEFAHLPLILNEEHRKLSKREGTGSVMAWLQRGILPPALINYVALLGWHPQDEREFFAFEELVHAFDLDRVGRSGGIFDPVKLEWLSGEHIKALTWEELEKLSRPFLQNTEFGVMHREELQPLIEAIRAGLHRLDEMPERLTPFSRQPQSPDGDAQHWLQSESAGKTLPLILQRWREITSAETEALLNAVREIGKQTGVKGKDLWMPLRAALTGTTAGPELKVIIAHLGAQEVIARLGRL